MTTTICTLTGFVDLFERFADSIEKHEWDRPKIVVTSRRLGIERESWTVLAGREPFVFARNANLAIRWAFEAGHVLLCNDDIELEHPIVTALEDVLERNPHVGIAAPMIAGGTGNRLQAASQVERFAPSALPPVVFTADRIPFICVLLRQEMIRAIGLLDERFDGYGGDDVDYCARAQDAGWMLGLAPRVYVRHGRGTILQASTSFLRTMSREQREISMREMDRRFADKRASRYLRRLP